MRILTAKNDKSCPKWADSEKSRLSPPTAVARGSGKPEIGRSRSTTRFQHESDTPGVVPWDIRIGLKAAVTCRSHVFVPNSIVIYPVWGANTQIVHMKYSVRPASLTMR